MTLKQDQKDFPHIAQDIQVAIDHENRMTDEQFDHMTANSLEFNFQYQDKYRDGQKSHGGNMWEMGAYQALENMEAEVLDQWSYCRQIRKVLDEIKEKVDYWENEGDEYAYRVAVDIKEILNRVKED
jgi:hypothetical protein